MVANSQPMTPAYDKKGFWQRVPVQKLITVQYNITIDGHSGEFCWNSACGHKDLLGNKYLFTNLNLGGGQKAGLTLNHPNGLPI